VRRAAPFLAATAVYAALTTALTWPLARQSGSRVANDLGDSLLNMWLLAWNARVLPLTEAWWNAPQFYPASGVMAFSEHLLGLSPIATPILFASNNPVLAYNVAFFLSFLLSAVAGHALGWSLTRRHDAALVAGLAFGFAPYRAAQLGHVQVLSTYWMPLALVGLAEFRRSCHWPWLILFGGAWLMQALACGYYLFFLSVLVVLWLVWFVVWRSWKDLGRIAVAWAAAAALLSPVLYGYWRIQRQYGFQRLPDEIRSFSADLASVLEAPPNLRFWGWLDTVDRPESALFPGLAILAIVVAGAFVARRGSRSVLAFFVVGAVVMWAMCLGPRPTYMNDPFLPWGPYAWLMAVPGADGLRVPARFWMLAVLCLSAAGAIAFAQLAARWPRARMALAAAACAGILSDGWQAPMDFPAPPDNRPNRTGAVARVDLPFVESHDLRALYRAISHQRPLVNGYSGHFAPHHGVLKRLLNDGDHDALRHMTQFGDLEVVVAHEYDRDGRWRTFAETYPGIERVFSDQRYSSFRIRESADGARYRRMPAPILPIAGLAASANQEKAALMTDGDLETRWELGRGQEPGDRVAVDLGVPRIVRGVELALGRYTADYPRALLIETSADGLIWQKAWQGRGGGPTLTAAVFHPTVVPVTFPVGAQEARYVRLTQLASDPVFYWSIAELRVYGR
jgi:F5/8 type C domain